MNENKKIIGWIVGGVIVGAIVVYFAISGNLGLLPPQTFEGEKTDKGTVVAPGASPISDEGIVVTQEGKPVKQDIDPGSPEAPKQSDSISKDEVPAKAIKISVSASGFSPSEFTVNAGEAVALSFTSMDHTHLFYFDDPSLKAVAVGVGPEETRLITFNVPNKKGEYTFYCDVPGHAARGEVGKMIVK